MAHMILPYMAAQGFLGQQAQLLGNLQRHFGNTFDGFLIPRDWDALRPYAMQTYQ